MDDIVAILTIVGYILIGIFIASILTDDPFTPWGAVIMIFWPMVLAVLILTCVVCVPVWLGGKIREWLDL